MSLNDNLTLDRLTPEVAELVRSGVRNPHVKSLSPGAKLYRFACSSVSKPLWPAGPWWIQQTAFHQIVQQVVQQPDGLGLGWTARRALAIRQGWSTVDAVVEAIVAEKINVFCGFGKKQYREVAPNGMYVTWEGWPNIEQLFIPFISDKAGLTKIGQRALTIYRSDTIASYQLF
jgi:hypothetical protein